MTLTYMQRHAVTPAFRTIKGEQQIPNAPEGWRNYPVLPRCVCG